MERRELWQLKLRLQKHKAGRRQLNPTRDGQSPQGDFVYSLQRFESPGSACRTLFTIPGRSKPGYNVLSETPMTPVKKADLTIKQTQALEAIRRSK